MSDDLHPGEIEPAEVGTSIETVTLDADHLAVAILKRTSDGELWVTVDGSDPAVDTAGSHCMPEGINELRLPSPKDQPTVVKMIASAGTISVTVTGLRP